MAFGNQKWRELITFSTTNNTVKYLIHAVFRAVNILFLFIQTHDNMDGKLLEKQKKMS